MDLLGALLTTVLVISGTAFCFTQLLAIIVSLASKYDEEIWQSFQEENDDGTVSLYREAPIDWILTTIGTAIFKLREKGFVEYLAKEDAKTGVYNNRFKEKSYQEVYNKSFLNERKEFLKSEVNKDLINETKRTSFLNDSEKAIYQNLYLEKIAGKENVENLVQERVKKLYAEIELEPVDDEIFSQIVSQSKYN